MAVIDGSVVPPKQSDKDQQIKLRYDIKAHFDQVTDMIYLDQLHILASSSEDC